MFLPHGVGDRSQFSTSDFTRCSLVIIIVFKRPENAEVIWIPLVRLQRDQGPSSPRRDARRAMDASIRGAAMHVYWARSQMAQRERRRIQVVRTTRKTRLVTEPDSD